MTRRLLTLTAVALLWPAAVSAEISQPSEVPSYLSGRDDLALQRSALMGQWSELQQAIADQNAQCSQVAEDSPMVDACRSNQAKILSEVKAYKDDLQQYEEALEKIDAVFVNGLSNAQNQGAPLNAPLTNDEANRSAFNYAKVMDQFRVDKSERYGPGEKTYCNIFVWDVTRAMDAEIPHYVVKGNKTGASAVDTLGQFKVEAAKREELNVNGTVRWLKKHGPANGWRRVDARMAQEMASAGHPAVAVWPNPRPEKHGHIAMIRPGSLPLGTGGVAIAQAGRLVLSADHLDTGFNDPELRKPVQYWYHE